MYHAARSRSRASFARFATGLTLALLVGEVATSSALASPNGLVISEFRFRGPAGAGDEFVELKNTSTNPVEISGYRL